MPALTMAFALVLIGLGVGVYFLTGRQSWTALIPAIAGVLLFVCGYLAQNTQRRKHAMHAAVLVAILGFAGAMPGVIKFVKWQTGGETPARPTAVKTQTAMAGVLLPYIVLCVRSFVDARRSRNPQLDD
jgi:hypothetical protein